VELSIINSNCATGIVRKILIFSFSFIILSCGRFENPDKEDKSFYFIEARDVSKNSLTYYYNSTQFRFNLCNIDDPFIDILGVREFSEKGMKNFSSNRAKVLFYWRILKQYRNVKFPYDDGKHLIFLHYSGGENILYNWNYIANFPQKYIHTVQVDVKIGKRNFFIAVIVNFIYGIWGVLQAVIMLVIGAITGTILHPIDTILTFIPSFFRLIIDTSHALYMFFVGYI